MEQFYSWIQAIIFYMIFMNFMTNLLPGKAYARYVRLFMGMVLILLVIRPLTGSLRLDEQLARCFEEISFQKEAGELQGQLEEIERQRFETIADEYEKTVSAQAEARLEKSGYGGAQVKASVDREQGSDSFGMIEEMEVSVGDVEAWEYSAGEMPESDEINNQLKQLEKTQQLKQTKQSEKEQEIRQVSIEKNQIQVHLGKNQRRKGKRGRRDWKTAAGQIPEIRTQRRRLERSWQIFMDWKSVILKFKSGTEKKKRDQWIVLFAAGLLLLLFSASGSGKPAHRKEDLPVSGEVLEKMDRTGANDNDRGRETGGGNDGSGREQEEKDAEASALSAYEKQLEERVKELLRMTEGVGEADVMIVLKSSGEKIIHEDQKRRRASSEETDSAGGTRKTVDEEAEKSAVFVENGSEKEPIVEKELRPAVEGVVISAQGGGNASVKTEISEAMQALFNIPAHKIKVLKRVD